MSELWNELVTLAMVGTSKKDPDTVSLPNELKTSYDVISKTSTDKEDVFLKTGAIAYAYKQTGWLPKKPQYSPITLAASENKSYCTHQASACLQEILDETLYTFLELWLLKCKEKNLLISPTHLPVLLEIASANIELQNLILDCCGERGLWLAQLNPLWQIKTNDPPEEIVKTGKPDERKKALRSIRETEPQLALALLNECWKQEQANTRFDLLELLKINLSIQDENFLRQILDDKSQKVKDRALELLKMIPGSFICEEVFAFIKPLITIKKSNALLGLVQKETLDIDLNFELPAQFKKYGFEDMNVVNDFSEKELTFYHLLSCVPVHYWESHFSLSPSALLELFDKKKETKKYISALAHSANTFKQVEWGVLLYTKYKKLCFNLVPLFHPELREDIALSLVEDYANTIYVLKPIRNEEWSVPFCMALIKYAANEPYTYSKNYFRQIAHHFPMTLEATIESVQPTNENYTAHWNNIKAEIIQLIQLKKQLIASF